MSAAVPPPRPRSVGRARGAEPLVDILIPTYGRPAALAATLTSLCAQTERCFRVHISDQSETGEASRSGEVLAAARVLRLHGSEVEVHAHPERRGMAEQRQFLLDRSSAPHVLYLDDDLILEPNVVGRMLEAIHTLGCGFVGSAVIGLSHLHDVRPQEQAIELWEGRVRPERVLPGSREWQRYRLHNAANLQHVTERLALRPGEWRAYRVAWVGGCVLYGAAQLRASGGYGFWPELPPEHCGEDVLAQLRVMERFGGCGLISSGVYHMELPTTLRDRRVNAPELLRCATGG